MLFIIAIIAILIEAYLRREAIRGHHRLIIGSSEAHQCQSSQVVTYQRREAIRRHQSLIRSSSAPIIPSGGVPEEGRNHRPSIPMAINSHAARNQGGNHVREDCDPLGDRGGGGRGLRAKDLAEHEREPRRDDETHLHATQSAAIRRSSVTIGGNLATGGAPRLTKRTPLSQPSRT